MLKALTIQDLAIVRQLDLEFASGLTAITGETGAGKSILIGALGLALGDRADPAVVRNGAVRASVSATFDVSRNPPALALLAEHGLEADHECILRRVVGADGRSRAFCNATPVSVQLLKEIGEMLVDIHGQHAHHSLLQRPVQRAALDAHGRLDPLVSEVGEAHHAWQAARRALAELQGPHGDPASRAEFLRFQLLELEALDTEPGAVAALEAEHRRLAHAKRLREGCATVADAIYDSERSAAHSVDQARSALRELARIDPALMAVVELFEQAAINLQEAERELSHYQVALDVDPAQLAQVEQRLQSLLDAARKHRCDPSTLGEVAARLQAELGELAQRDSREQALLEEVRRAETAYMEAASRLRAGRESKARLMARAITGHLPELGMPHGRLQIEIQPAAEPAAHGFDEVEFLVTTNPDQPPRPLRKVASGGELSRISLAIQVAFAGASTVPVLVYDEVDTGIGGRVAGQVARHLQSIAKEHQVLCITHLAQVASAGAQHLLITKEVQAGVTQTAVRPLDAEERVEEVARMLGGTRTSERALAHARELLTG